MTLRDVDDREERTRALRGLLGSPIVGADEQAYALIRLAGTSASRQHPAGDLRVPAQGRQHRCPRVRPADGGGAASALRITPASLSGRKRPPDEWPALSDRACVILLLTLVALERSGAQTAIAELARDVERAGADVHPPISVDFRQRSERVAFADGLDLLCAWGIVQHSPARARATRGKSKVMTRRCSRSIAGASPAAAPRPRGGARGDDAGPAHRRERAPSADPRGRESRPRGAARATADRGPRAAARRPRRRRSRLLPQPARADRERRGRRDRLRSRAAGRGQRLDRRRPVVHGRAVPHELNRQAGRPAAL